MIVDAERLDHARVGHKRVGAFAIDGAELVRVLEDRLELEAIAGHQPHCALDRLQSDERSELVEQEQHRPGGAGRGARHVSDGLRDQQA